MTSGLSFFFQHYFGTVALKVRRWATGQAVPDSSSAADGNLFSSKRGSIACIISIKPNHRPDITKKLSKRS